MVQRKVPNKLGIQADHIKSEKRLGNLKPASCQHQDGKNRGGPEMKKKMKRSRSIKLSDIEGLKSSPLRKPIPQPGKPPPLDAATTAATPQKQPVVRSSHSSPNYMKATSSSAARKERSPVSSLNAQTDSDGKKVGRRDSSNAKLGSVSTNKPTKSLTKSSSFKLMRSLTKTTSFKPVRGTTKRCARGVALCKEMTAQKSTCSSTLKDSKFPAYLMLSPGATEAEGTSIMKVCPYTYCSLNGHHHNPVPPLKCFLKARRRSLKTQKSMKLEVLSPSKAKPSRVAKGKSDGGLLGFDDNKSLNKDAALVDSVPILKDVSTDFFIEIYANNIEDSTAAIDKSTEENDVEPADLGGGPGEQNNDSCFDGDSETGAEEGNIDQVAESLSDTSAESEIQVVENFEQNAYIDSEELDITQCPFDENEVDMDVAYSTILAEEEATAGSPDSKSEIEDYISEATDMVWEEGPHFVSETDEESYYSNKIDDDELSANNECTVEIKKVEGIWLDDITITYIEEILADDVLKELFEESASVDTQCNNSCEMDSMANSKDEIPFTEVTGGGLTCDQFAPSENIFEVLAAMEGKDKEAETDFISTLMTSASMGVTATESEEASDNSQINELCETENAMFQTSPQPGDVENDGTTDMTLEAFDASQEDECQPDDAGQEPVGVSTIEQELLIDEAGDTADAMENQKEVAESKVLFEVSDSSPTLSEADQDDSLTNDDQYSMMHKTDEFQLDEIAEDSSSSEDLADESGLVEPQRKQGDEHHGNTNALEKPKSFEEDQDETNRFKVLPSSATDEHLDSKENKISLAVNNAEEEVNMEEEACSKSNTAETVLMVNNGINPGSASKYLYTRSSSKQELPHAENNRRWTIGCKKPIKDDLEEDRDFNPKDPNFLPVIPDPEAEKVDLRHQMIDDKKNAEEWMLDYALQQAVTKLAPARKRKVALLVEAFETVLPIPKYKPHIRTSAAFSPRAIQACS